MKHSLHHFLKWCTVIVCLAVIWTFFCASVSADNFARFPSTVKITTHSLVVTTAASVMPVSVSGNSIKMRARALTKFDKSIQVDAAEQTVKSIHDIMQELENLEKDYIDTLQDRRSSYGLFALGEYDDDVENSETRYLAGLEWRIFNDGYYEAVRRDTKKILQTQLEFYQLRNDMKDRQLEEDLYNLFLVENFIHLAHYREKTTFLKQLLGKRTEQMAQGYTTELDVFDIRRQLKNAQNKFAFYRESSSRGVVADQLNTLNVLEFVKLKPVTTLIELAQSNSYNLKIQDNFIERSEFFPAWVDDIAVNINASYKQEFYEKERTILGIEVEIPLMLDTSRQSLVDTQKRIYKYQAKAIKYRLDQRVKKLFSFFNFQQRRLLGQQEDLELLFAKTQKNEKKEQFIIQQLADDPARNLDSITLNMIDARYEALQTRLKIYEIILKLMTLTQADSATALFEFPE
jgi:hypothetical protein